VSRRGAPLWSAAFNRFWAVAWNRAQRLKFFFKGCNYHSSGKQQNWTHVVPNICYVSNRVGESILAADGSVVEALNATDNFISTYDKITSANDALATNIVALCNPSNTSFAVVSVAGVSSDLNMTIGNLTSVRDTMVSLRSNLASLSSQLNHANRTLRHFASWWFYFASAMVLVLDAMVIMFMIGTVLAMRRAQPRRLRNIVTKTEFD
jgi:hypothetical protein